jgi:hypothetical protein
VKYRPKTFTCLFGNIRFERAYYHCQHCHHGWFPPDKALRLTSRSLTPAADEVTTLAGIETSFARAAKRQLLKLAGIRLSESTVERITEEAGERLGAVLEQGQVLGASETWDWNRDATGQPCAYVSLDATGILMQGPAGAKVEGRMVNVGMVFNPKPRESDEESVSKPCEDVRYVAGLLSLEELGEQMRRQAAQVGMDAVPQWIALSDAGSGFEHFVDIYFPRAVKIVDFRHATEHLTPLSKLLPSAMSSEELFAGWCHMLKHEGGSKMLEILEGLDRRSMSQAARAEHEKALTYYRNHMHKMNYPEYLRRGWYIGSGSIESACKNVINQRLSQGGMRWGEQGSDNVSHLRALFRSEESQWEAFWSQSA